MAGRCSIGKKAYIMVTLPEARMAKHVQLVAILTIVYRSLLILLAIILVLFSGWLMQFLQEMAWRHGHSEIPPHVVEILPLILCGVAVVLVLFSIVGIIAAVGLLRYREWARIVTLILSFLNLFHFPVGTALGVYGIWVLMKDETMKLFNPTAGGQLASPGT